MNIKKEYVRCWRYLKEGRNYFLLALTIFVYSAVFGIIFPSLFNETIKKFIEEIVSKTQGLGYWRLFMFIFENNLYTAFIGIISGIVFGIIPVLFAFFNGYVLGFVMDKSVSTLGLGVFLRLLPHGIFEIPALAISLGLGMKIGTSIFIKKKSRGKVKGFVYNLKNSLMIFFLVILPLLLVAALIEAGLMFVLG